MRTTIVTFFVWIYFFLLNFNKRGGVFVEIYFLLLNTITIQNDVVPAPLRSRHGHGGRVQNRKRKNPHSSPTLFEGNLG